MIDFDSPRQMAEFRGYGVPDLVVAAAKSMALALEPYRPPGTSSFKGGKGGGGGEGEEGKDPETFGPAYYINSQPEGYCGICGTDSVGGPGKGGCVNEKECVDFTPPVGYEGLFDFEEMEFKDRWVVLGGLETVTGKGVRSEYVDWSKTNRTEMEEARERRRRGRRRMEEEGVGGVNVNETGFLTREALEEALRQSVYALVPEVDTRPEAFQAGVWRADADDIFTHLFATPEESFFVGTPGAEVTHRHKLALITTSKVDATAFIQALQDGEANTGWRRHLIETQQITHAQLQTDPEDTYTDAFASYLRSFISDQEGITLQHVGISLDRVLHIPAYNSQALLQQKNTAALHLGSYSVVVTDPDMPAVPLDHIEYKKAYLVHVEQFPPNSTIKIELVGIPKNAADSSTTNIDANKQASRISYQKILTGAASLKTDGEGEVDFPYKFRLLETPPGEYYVVVTDVGSGAYGQSPLFTLATTRRRRKLYGPTMRI